MPIYDRPFVDKNNERKMLLMRAWEISLELRGKIFPDAEDAGTFLFREGQSDISKIDEGGWTPFGRDDLWGYREQYCWFKQRIRIPERFAGRPVIYEVNPTPDAGWSSRAFQFIIFVNGEIVQGLDPAHTFIFLTQNAKGGEEYDIALNAYCDDWEFRGQAKMRGTMKTFDPDVNRLSYDFDNLYATAHQFDADSNARVQITKYLNEAVNRLNSEVYDYDREAFSASARETSEFLRTSLAKMGSTEDALVTAIGQTHIDTAWLWRTRQTRDKAGRSFATVCNLMKEFPDYRFIGSQAQQYAWVKEDYPELFEKIKAMVAAGRWSPEGGMWVEADTNVPSGESLVRQFLVGKRFFKKEFGVNDRILWLPDVFGYSAALPQIMKLSGIEYFMTTKISWNTYNRFPYDTFEWEGIDGTRILSHFPPARDSAPEGGDYHTNYNADLNVGYTRGAWQYYNQKNLNNNVLVTFGHGDGGGGPTRQMLENADRMKEGLPGIPRLRQEFPTEFFDRLAKEVGDNPDLPRWRGELYLEFHRGTLTAQARNKKYNRKSEVLLHDVETLGVLAERLAGKEYPRDAIDTAWKTVLLNQFHDIIPGSSITPVYRDSKAEYEKVTADGRALRQDALASIAGKIATDGASVVVFNTLGMALDTTAVTDLPEGWQDGDCLLDEDGSALPTQKTYDGRLIFLAKGLPAKGYKTYRIGQANATFARADFAPVDADTKRAENDFYKLTFNEKMEIASLWHKGAGRFVSDRPLGVLTGYEDRPHEYEAWELEAYYTEKPFPIDCVDDAKVIERGPVRTVVEVDRHFFSSSIRQYYVFYAHTARIDTAYDIDWKEKKIVVKADYPVDVNADNATFDIQFGNVSRPTNNNTLWDYAKFEVCGHKWADLSDNGFGLSVLNDCKYGWNVKEGHIRPTLLRSAAFPNTEQDRERHTFTYALYAHVGRADESDVVREGYALNFEPLALTLPEQKAGVLPGRFSLISSDRDNVIVETVKHAEDGDGVIVRLYETWNRRTGVTLTCGLPVASVTECDLMEENDKPVKTDGNAVELIFKPFEIKTLKIRFK